MVSDPTTMLDSFIGGIFAASDSVFGPEFTGVLMLALAIVVFAVVVGTFWKVLAKEVIYELRIDHHTNNLEGILKDILVFIKFLLSYTIIFPAISFLWFAVLASLIYILSRTLTLQEVFPMALAVVLATRITAYFDEEIAGDIAKVLPIALLGTVVIEPGMFSEATITQRLNELSERLGEFVPFFLYAVYIEWGMRLLLGVKHFVTGQGLLGNKKPKDESEYGTHKEMKK